MSISTLVRLNKHKITHHHPHFKICMSLNKSINTIEDESISFKLPCLFQLFTLGVNQSVLQICAIKLRFLLRQTGVDSDFTQNF